MSQPGSLELLVAGTAIPEEERKKTVDILKNNGFQTRGDLTKCYHTFNDHIVAFYNPGHSTVRFYDYLVGLQGCKCQPIPPSVSICITTVRLADHLKKRA